MFKNKKFIFTLLSLTLLLSANFALAQGGTGGTDVGQEIFGELEKAGGSSGAGLSEKDPREIVANIIKSVLGLLGMVFLALMVYAGFLWMTSHGDNEKVQGAQKIIKTAVIGLLVILLAYALTSFVVNVLVRATA